MTSRNGPFLRQKRKFFGFRALFSPAGRDYVVESPLPTLASWEIIDIKNCVTGKLPTWVKYMLLPYQLCAKYTFSTPMRGGRSGMFEITAPDPRTPHQPNFATACIVVCPK